MLDEILEITGWFEPRLEDDRENVKNVQLLISNLADIAPIFTGLISKNDPDDPGIDFLNPTMPDRFVKWHAKFSDDFPQDAEIKLIVGAKPFLGPEGETVSSYRVVFTWGDQAGFDTLKISIPMRFNESPDMVAFLTEVVKAITAWRTCSLTTAQPSALKMTGKLFDDSHSVGFGIWLPKLTPDIDLSDAHSVTTVNGGFMIISFGDMFNLANKAALDRVHRIDGHLMENGDLPGLSRFQLPI